jgi:hypothetical protein
LGLFSFIRILGNQTMNTQSDEWTREQVPNDDSYNGLACVQWTLYPDKGIFIVQPDPKIRQWELWEEVDSFKGDRNDHYACKNTFKTLKAAKIAGRFLWSSKS